VTMQQPKVVESSNSLGLATTSAQVLNERCFDFSPRKKARGANWGEGSTVTLSSDGCSDRGGDSPGPGNDVWGEKGGGEAGEGRRTAGAKRQHIAYQKIFSSSLRSSPSHIPSIDVTNNLLLVPSLLAPALQ